ncbi:MAG: nucleoside triphosphate pyrophosphohydrolase [Leptospiraceae bacterium]|nr:nucleoside triphosphate pyrophosphohydrolase [Leptospiraceae bacterium]
MADYLPEIQRLKEITDQLRSPGGCEWDQKQTMDSMRRDLLEEVYELIDAIQRRDMPNLAEEIGDVLFLVCFYARLGEEEGFFTLAEIARNVADKLVRRHPHVFGSAQVDGVGDILNNWDAIKAAEKEGDPDQKPSSHTFASQAYGFLPALDRAQKLGGKAARLGFDWDNADSVFDKIVEELAELRNARDLYTKPTAKSEATSTKADKDSRRKADMELELGDLLFAISSLARHLGVNAELGLHRSLEKFIRRFQSVEDQLKDQQRTLPGVPIDELETLWAAAKADATANS